MWCRLEKNKLFAGHSIVGTKENTCDENNAAKVNRVNATDGGASRVGEKQIAHLKMEIKRITSHCQSASAGGDNLTPELTLLETRNNTNTFGGEVVLCYNGAGEKN